MFAGGAYSRYSALENPYIVRETTDAGSKVATFTARQRQKKALEEGKLTKANNEVERLTKFVTSDTFPAKPGEFQRERKRELNHQRDIAATAQKRVVHYQEKIDKQKLKVGIGS
jgi:hypothetical protein